MKFEYKIINVSKVHLSKDSFQKELMEKLNLLGSEGWEMVNLEGIQESNIFFQRTYTKEILFVFKRQII